MQASGPTGEYVDITLESNRKLAGLHWNKTSAAVGFDFKTGGSTSYPKMFLRENGRWILTY